MLGIGLELKKFLGRSGEEGAGGVHTGEKVGGKGGERGEKVLKHELQMWEKEKQEKEREQKEVKFCCEDELGVKERPSRAPSNCTLPSPVQGSKPLQCIVLLSE